MAHPISFLSTSPPTAMMLSRSIPHKESDLDLTKRSPALGHHSQSRAMGGLSSLFLPNPKSAQLSSSHLSETCDHSARSSLLDAFAVRDASTTGRGAMSVSSSLNHGRHVPTSLQNFSVPSYAFSSDRVANSAPGTRSRFAEHSKPVVRKVGFHVEARESSLESGLKRTLSEVPSKSWLSESFLASAPSPNLGASRPSQTSMEDIFGMQSLSSASVSILDARCKLEELSSMVELATEAHLGLRTREELITEDLERELLEKAQGLDKKFCDPLVKKAFTVAASAHRGQTRKDGKPYLSHCLETAMILSQCGCNSTVLAAGLLHDVLDDTMMEEDQLRDIFGAEVTGLVVGVSKLSEFSQLLRDNGTPAQSSTEINSLLQMIHAMDDPRVVLVKLADRLHNLRTLSHLSPAKQQVIAKESLYLFAPLANRLGIWALKAEIEDICFQYIFPEEHRVLAESTMGGGESEIVLRESLHALHDRLVEAEVGIVDLTGRPKNLYGIHTKMQKKGYQLSDIKDVRGIRLIVPDKDSCYEALRVVEGLWESDFNHFKDYIKNPKDNGYQSIHVVVKDKLGRPLEVQIRTKEMHQNAEFGMAAHWLYKEDTKKVARKDGKGAKRSFKDDAAFASKYNSSSSMDDNGKDKEGSGQEPDGAVHSQNWSRQMVRYQRWLLSWQAELADLKVRVSPANQDLRPPCPFPQHQSECPFAHMCGLGGGGCEGPGNVGEPVLVAVLNGGKLTVEHLDGGSTLADLLHSQKRAERDICNGRWQVLVNRELAEDVSLQLRTGDRVELFWEDEEEHYNTFEEEEEGIIDTLELDEASFQESSEQWSPLVLVGR